ncbi:hypothetical protein [Streptomyces halobius]|uniref:Uncharacterized protein n=1 Tax=Streptomyces halobius TaxID=2879846 RepID=A0ABY4M050_9ACTN|nr:hypothetical protein [Streptomyces halobius]UQA91122.1 hypothetical protein K9S39_03785 [Streptomyces halobius]
MPRISTDTRARNEEAIRAAMDRLLRGELPSGGRCDIKTLAAEAGVPRTGFYAKRNRDGSERRGPYQHLAEEFERRLKALQDAGTVPDPRDGQIARLKEDNAALRDRVSARDAEIAELKTSRQRALSQITAQDAELQRLRRQLESGTVRRLPAPGPAPFGSCS